MDLELKCIGTFKVKFAVISKPLLSGVRWGITTSYSQSLCQPWDRYSFKTFLCFLTH